MTTARAVVAEIDLNALKRNLQEVRRRVPTGCRVLSVVKANAYGHGAVPVSKALVAAGIDMLGVALVEEGITLRQSGIDAPILVMGGIFEEQVPAIFEHRLTPAVYRFSLAKALSRESALRSVSIPVHLKVDTGMGRLGFRPEESEDFVRRVQPLDGLVVDGIMTHFAEADLADTSSAIRQLDLFLQVCDRVKKMGVRIPIRHAANSAAITDIPASHLEMVRSGMMLYGYHPAREDSALAPVLTLKTRIAYLKKVPAGTPISYGGTFVTGRESLIATLPIGYADGYPRTLSNTGFVLVRGCRAPVVGRVCMDMTLVDVTEVPEVRVEEHATLIGGEGAARIDAHQLGAWAGTICYEILSRIGSRVQRVYV